MVAIHLPDGSRRDFEAAVSGAQIAAAIGPRLAKDALALKADGMVKDLAYLVEQDTTVEIVTANHNDSLELLRHDCAHVLAEAVQELFPETQVTFGPATENGFFYDFARKEPFTIDDLEVIEKRMHEIVDRDETITREVWDRDDAIRLFMEMGEKYKAEHIETLPADMPRSRSTGRANGSTSARGRTCPRPASWAMPSSCCGCPALTGAAIPGTSSCSASTAPAGRPKSSSRPTCTWWRKPKSATTGASARR